MTDYYIKNKNGRYERVGYSHPDMPDGFYYKERNRKTSIPWWLGPHDGSVVNTKLLTEICKNDEGLSQFLVKLTDENSEELKAYRQHTGFIQGPLKVYNWSMQDLSLAVLQWVYKRLVEKDGIKTDGTVDDSTF